MNVRSNISNQELGKRAHGVDFNNDCSYFSVATDEGFNIYKSESSDLEGFIDIEGGAFMTKILENSQILGVATRLEPNKLNLYDTNLRAPTGSITLSRSVEIVSAHLTRTHIAIATPLQVHLYSHSKDSMAKLAAYDTSPNRSGLCVLGRTVCVFPGRSQGQVQIVQLPSPGGPTKPQVGIVPAHTGPLRALCLSPEEDAVASASTTGTLIRVHSTGTRARLLELRRGIAPARVHSLAISPTGAFLACTADTNTLHVFALPAEPGAGAAEAPGPGLENGWTAVEHAPSPPAAGEAGSSSYFGFQKWGSLARVPFAPRVFRDVYSIASASFDPGVEEGWRRARSGSDLENQGPRKGVVGWVDETTIVVLSAGMDARYERFRLSWDGAGAANVRRVGWNRFMRPN